ncbi:MAG: hypothetical protein GY929_21315 [Actinomycetia bacterium]|nr:hypothetical protein [Actinomycetes bacterium]
MADLSGRALYPITDLLDATAIPFGGVLDAAASSDFISRIWVGDHHAFTDGDNVVIELELGIQGALEVDLPGDIVSIVMAGGPAGWTDLDARVIIGPDASLTLFGVTLALRFDESALRDVATDGPADITIAADLTFSANGVALAVAEGATLDPATVADTAIIVEADNVLPVFGPIPAPYYAPDVANAKGLAADRLAISIPPEYLGPDENGDGLRFELEDFWAGTDGISTSASVIVDADHDDSVPDDDEDGTGPAVLTEAPTGTIFGVDYRFRRFDLDIVTNTVNAALLGLDVLLERTDDDNETTTTPIELEGRFQAGGIIGVGLEIPAGTPPDQHVLSVPISDTISLALNQVDGEIGPDTWQVTIGGSVTFTVDADAADSFSGTLLGSQAAGGALDLVLEADPDGVRVAEGTGGEVHLPINQDLGPLRILTLHLVVELIETDDGTDALRLQATVDLQATLGIVKVTVAGIGAGAQVAIAETSGSGLDVQGAFVAPAGVGLAIGVEGSPVSGGGFLAFYPDEGRYEAVVSLQIVKVGISAFIIVDTQALDSGGWSVFFALFIDLPSIQLGFGFTLEGVGGIAGINRTVDADALLAAARSGGLDPVLFPEDPVGNATAIIDAFSTFFPPAEGRYVFGPVVKLAWGGGTITARLGVVIELPDPIVLAILGSVGAVFPDEEAAIVVIQMDVAGVIDFAAGTIAVDAFLHDSSIAGFDLTGGMSLRASLKGDPNFLLAVGGFHPGFEPPSGFPVVPRVGMEVSIANVVHLSFEGYFAVTSQTVQFGTAFHLWANLAVASIEGGFEFNALIEFDPFRLTADLDMYLAVAFLGIDLVAVRLAGQLVGPKPWTITGYAEFRALGSTHQIELNESNGAAAQEAPSVPPGLLELLVAALADDDSWEIGEGRSEVQLSEPPVRPDAEHLRAQPAAQLAVSQRVVPLDTDINTYGRNPAIEHTRFELEVTTPGLGSGTSVDQWFAPGQYQVMEGDDSAQLSAPSFEPMPAGLAFGAGAVAGPERAVETGHKVVVVDPELPLIAEPAPEPDVAQRKHPDFEAIIAIVGGGTPVPPPVGGVAPIEIHPVLEVPIDDAVGIIGDVDDAQSPWAAATSGSLSARVHEVLLP